MLKRYSCSLSPLIASCWMSRRMKSASVEFHRGCHIVANFMANFTSLKTCDKPNIKNVDDAKHHEIVHLMYFTVTSMLDDVNSHAIVHTWRILHRIKRWTISSLMTSAICGVFHRVLHEPRERWISWNVKSASCVEFHSECHTSANFTRWRISPPLHLCCKEG